MYDNSKGAGEANAAGGAGGAGGLMVLNLLRADPLTAHIPVIAVSADAMRVTVENGLAAGFFRYNITKPIKVALFMQAIDEALELAAKRVTHVQSENV